MIRGEVAGHEDQEEAHEGQKGQVTGQPALRVLSLGAGVQSTTLALLAVEGVLPKPDAAIFADTGWEPKAVYEHLGRLEKVMGDAGIPVYRVSTGNIRSDALDASVRFAQMPVYILNPDGSEGMSRRQCTSEYKLKPIKVKVRELLGFPHPIPVPRGVYVEQWIGISLDEVGRAKPADVNYQRIAWPLLDLKMTRDDCLRWLRRHGWETTPKSACIGCPFHGNRQWRELRDTSPDEWQDAVDFDAAIRKGNARATANGDPLLGTAFLHRSRLPLDQAPIDRVTRGEWKDRQVDIFGQLADLDEEEEGTPDGCSPYGCRSGGAAD